MANVYTRGGDKGQTGLLGGSRTDKDDIRVEAYGTMDEANAAIGMAYALSEDEDIRKLLHYIQKRIFVVGAELASDEKGREMLQDKVGQEDIDLMETEIDRYLDIIGKQKEFVIPGKNPASSALHIARTAVRRGERRIITYANRDPKVRRELIQFANRLSDLLFVLARMEEYNTMVKDIIQKVKNELGLDTLENDDDKLLTLAKRMAAVARMKAKEIGVPIVLAVVDIGGNLVYFEREKKALLASRTIAIDKAYTANALQAPTDALKDLAKEEGDLYGLQASHNGRLVAFGGGFPIVVNGVQIGGLGISGGSTEEDITIAKAALTIL
ncbi:MAG: cob(I)yrinic acid a,c-diamide adenosyltransferase [Eubacteriaceae bacterium]|nr:cob(I)yrinic acid a,c-diamide adenosyltransferase [Eubacteriaceae bacterium]